MSRYFLIFGLLLFMAGCQNMPFAVVNSGQKQDQDQDKDPIMNPEDANEKAPDQFKVKFSTTKGDFVVQIERDWAPKGADRFFNLVKIGYFKDIAIFRAIDGFMFQFGIHGDPDVSAVWREATIEDDPVLDDVSNQPGFITYAMGGPDTRTVQCFINLGDNKRLDSMGFPPFGQVVEGMDIVKQINTEYGENDRTDQRNIQTKGNAFIKEKYPNVDYIKSATLVEE